MESFDESKNDIMQNIIYVIEKKYEEELDKVVKEQKKKLKKLEKSMQISNTQHLDQTIQANLVSKEFRIDSLNNLIEKRDDEIRNLKNIQINLKLENQSLNREIIIIQKETNRIKDLNDFLNNNPNIKKEFEILEEKYKSKEKDVYDLESIKNEQNKQIKSLETKLNKLQRFLKENGLIKLSPSRNKEIDMPNFSNDIDQKASLGNKMDGSDSFHFERREGGKFGSLPSFDNYDDEYNEKFDDEI